MHRATADALAQALTWRLRELRIRVGIAELEQANAILQTQDDWNDAELEQVLLPIFAKRHDDRLLVSRLIGEMLTRPTSPPASPPELEPETNDDTTSERPPPPPPDPLWQQFVRRVRSLLRSKWTIPILWFLAALSFVPAIIGPLSDVVRQVSLRIDAILAGLGGALRNPLGGDLLSKGQDFQSLQLAVVVRHAVVSSLTASGAVLVLLAIRLTFKKTPMVTVRRRKVDEKRAVVGDESVFRVGSLGGSAAPFLDPVLAQEIVELITYRQTERLRRDLDVPATIERRARGDRDTLVFERRRELPTVVILVDLATDARHWNTLPEEFKTSLEKQGLRVETLPYYGTLSRPSPYATHSSDTVEGTLNALADRTGWMLTAIFGDLKRLSVADVAILSAQREQGPVLAFDYTDPRIWDARHAAFETLGLGPYPATGFAVRQALATAFAPDRSATRSAKSVRADKPAFSICPRRILNGRSPVPWSSQFPSRLLNNCARRTQCFRDARRRLPSLYCRPYLKAGSAVKVCVLPPRFAAIFFLAHPGFQSNCRRRSLLSLIPRLERSLHRSQRANSGATRAGRQSCSLPCDSLAPCRILPTSN